MTMLLKEKVLMIKHMLNEIYVVTFLSHTIIILSYNFSMDKQGSMNMCYEISSQFHCL